MPCAQVVWGEKRKTGQNVCGRRRHVCSFLCFSSLSSAKEKVICQKTCSHHSICCIRPVLISTTPRIFVSGRLRTQCSVLLFLPYLCMWSFFIWYCKVSDSRRKNMDKLIFRASSAIENKLTLEKTPHWAAPSFWAWPFPLCTLLLSYLTSRCHWLSVNAHRHSYGAKCCTEIHGRPSKDQNISQPGSADEEEPKVMPSATKPQAAAALSENAFIFNHDSFLKG